MHKNDSKLREDILVLGCAFNEKLANIDYQIMGKDSVIADARERIELARDDRMLLRECRDARQDLQKGLEGLESLKTLHHDIATHWKNEERRIIGQLFWAPPIGFSTIPGQYTLDLAVIRINSGILDGNNYLGNIINIGNKYTRHQFMDKIYLNPSQASSHSFKFPGSRLVKLQGQVPKIDLIKQPMIDSTAGEPCLVVFKNGAKTDITIGKADNVSSYTRRYFSDTHVESREWPIIPTNKDSGPFSSNGDSGSCVADAFSRVGGILTGGCGATESSDVTYVTPISYIMEVLHKSKHFQHAHLNPIL